MTINMKGLNSRSINNQGNRNQMRAVDSNTRSDSSGSSSSPTGSDKVSLTASATQLNSLEERINSLSVVDTTRVAATRDALASGTHQINPKSTADNLLASEYAFAQLK